MQGSEFRVQGSGFFGFRVDGLGFRIEFRVLRLEVRVPLVQCSVFRAQGSGLLWRALLTLSSRQGVHEEVGGGKICLGRPLPWYLLCKSVEPDYGKERNLTCGMHLLAAAERRANTAISFNSFTPKSGPKFGPDCLMRAEFA